MKNYRKRIADSILQRKLKGMAAVLIQGPKWCGKTTAAEQQARSTLYMDESDSMQQNLELANLSPKTLLAVDTPRLSFSHFPKEKIYKTLRFGNPKSRLLFRKSELRKIISEKIFRKSEGIFRKSRLFSSKFRAKNSEREALFRYFPFDIQIYYIFSRNPNRVNGF